MTCEVKGMGMKAASHQNCENMVGMHRRSVGKAVAADAADANAGLARIAWQVEECLWTSTIDAAVPTVAVVAVVPARKSAFEQVKTGPVTEAALTA
mmetsp:Transcript_29987/g.44598  ORF Transcript_29987/g.44598 Transcript_29987/m.44598 type:complete len:96 (-) Transcript_29987:1593-1880(-)